MSFKQEGAIKLLKLGDKLIYLGSSVSSTECDINTHLAKKWTALKRLSIYQIK